MTGLEISILEAGEAGGLGPLLRRSVQRPFRFLSRRLGLALEHYWMREIAAMAADARARVFVGRRDGVPLALVGLSEYAWETRLFGRPAGGLGHIALDGKAPGAGEVAARLLEHVLGQACALGLHFLACKVYADNPVLIHALEEAGFRLMDTMVEFNFDFSRQRLAERPPAPPGLAVRPACAGDEERLVALTLQAYDGYYGRYHVDERIGPALAAKAYEAWVRNAAAGYADLLLVAEMDGSVVAFSAWKKLLGGDEGLGLRIFQHNFGAVDRAYRRFGVFNLLTLLGMEAYEGKADQLDAVMHVSNYAIQRLNLGLGFQICDAWHSFHIWL